MAEPQGLTESLNAQLISVSNTVPLVDILVTYTCVLSKYCHLVLAISVLLYCPWHALFLSLSLSPSLPLMDAQLLQAWLTVMQSAHMKLAQLNLDLCLGHLPRLYQCCVSCLLSNKNAVKETAADAMQVSFTIQGCIQRGGALGFPTPPLEFPSPPPQKS